VLDIGAAYGETCLEALRRGATDYTANDIEPRHLKILARRVAEDLPSKLPNLKLISGGIPHPKFNDFIPTSSLDAVLLDSILHFLDPVQVTEALHQIFSWLKPGGKVFALMGTINLAVFKSEVRESLERDVKTFVETVKTQGQIDPKDIPGFTSNVSEDFDFSICPKETLEAQFNFSDGRFFRFHLETAKYLFETAGFIIEEIVYTPINTFPYKLNGRERVAVFAKKP
uniref:Methyltransferase domain-containing protein n=1 Tax=Acrobeloides nanus TaxID=290746 RepID=A0A914D7D9_9BILA